MERYTTEVKALTYSLIPLLAESLSLPPDALDKFFDTSENMQHRTKLNMYHEVAVTDSEVQGVGPHYDYGFLVFVRVFPAYILLSCSLTDENLGKRSALASLPSYRTSSSKLDGRLD